MTAELVSHAPVGPDTLADPAAVHAAYTAWVYRTGLSDNTKRSYSGEVAGFTAWLAAQDLHQSADVFTDPNARDYAVRDYRRYLLGEKRRMPKGVDSAMTSLGSLFGWIGLGSAKVPQSARQKRAPKSLPEEDVRAALRAAERRSPRDLAIVALAIGTGLRVSELAALDLDDVWITERRGAVQVRLGKGDQPRTVPMNTQTREAVKQWLAVRNTRTGAHGPLFLARHGQRLAVRTIRHVIDQVGIAAKLDLSPHVLRHTFGRTLVDRGVDVVTVADLMGHASVDTTRVYTRPTQEDAAEAVEKLHFDY